MMIVKVGKDSPSRLPPPDASQKPKDEQKARFREIGMLTKSLLEAEDALQHERDAHQATREALDKAKMASKDYEAILSSTSWRITAPLRWGVKRLRRSPVPSTRRKMRPE